MMESQPATISTAMVKILIAYGEKSGFDVRKILKAEGIDSQLLRKSNVRVPVEVFDRVWRQTVTLCENSNSGLHYGKEFEKHYPAGSVLFTMMLNCRDIAKALQVFVKYHRTMADAIQPVVTRDAELVSLSWQVQKPDHEVSLQLAQALLSIFHSIIGILSQGRISLVRVCFAFPLPDEIEDYQQLFRTKIVFNAPKNELLIRAGDLATEIRLANSDLFEVLENHAEHIVNSLAVNREWPIKVTHEITGLLASGSKADIRTVASILAVSSRGLQEKLKTERTTFRTLLQTVRKQVAMEQLKSPEIPICDVAFQLGYSDQSAFSRAFKRWTGVTPRIFRLQQKNTFSGMI